MSFDQSPITSASCSIDGVDLFVAWTSTAAAGSWHQLYMAGRLAWQGQDTHCHVPYPSGLGPNVQFYVGVVQPADLGTDFSTSLTWHDDRAKLAWQGGNYLSANLAGFRIYGSSVPGGPVSYAKALATVPAAIAGQQAGGYGTGGYGQGGYGNSLASYAWTSARLSAGVWSFAIAAYDSFGNQDPAPPILTYTISVPPRPPAASGTSRLSYSVFRSPGDGYGTTGYGTGGYGVGGAGYGAQGYGGGGYGTGGYGSGGGYGVGGYGLDGYGVGSVDGGTYATLTWLSSPG